MPPLTIMINRKTTDQGVVLHFQNRNLRLKFLSMNTYLTHEASNDIITME